MSEIRSGAAVGFVGLGQMGAPMATRLAEAGYQVQGYDVSEDAARSWAERSGVASPAATLAASAAGAAAIILMLPDSAVVRRVLAALLPGIAPGTVIVDMSSSEPLVTRELAAEAGRHGATLVDAPVSGGVAGAVSGRLTIMAGGAPGDVQRVRGLLDVLGARVVHVGGVGAGHAVKALNNLLSATHLLATSEAMAAAAEFGLDVPTVLGAINTSSGRNLQRSQRVDREQVAELHRPADLRLRVLAAADAQGHADRARPGRGGRHPGPAVGRGHRAVGRCSRGPARRRRPHRDRPLAQFSMTRMSKCFLSRPNCCITSATRCSRVASTPSG